jgi:hypothetical protein
MDVYIPALAVGGVHIQWGLDQCAVVGIGRLFFQLASGCNWLAGASWYMVSFWTC